MCVCICERMHVHVCVYAHICRHQDVPSLCYLSIILPCVHWRKFLVASPESPSEFGHILLPTHVKSSQTSRPVLYNSAKYHLNNIIVNNHPISFLGDFFSVYQHRGLLNYTLSRLCQHSLLIEANAYMDMHMPC
jgi:hypothetical protein